MRSLGLGLSPGLGAGLAPGPLMAHVVSATLRGGLRTGTRVALAPLVTDAQLVALCTLVLSALPAAVLHAFGVAGGLYVVWLGVEGWREARAPARTDAPDRAAPEPGGELRRGALVNVLSPHPWLFWIVVGGPLLLDALRDSALDGGAFVSAILLVAAGLLLSVESGRAL